MFEIKSNIDFISNLKKIKKKNKLQKLKFEIRSNYSLLHLMKKHWKKNLWN